MPNYRYQARDAEAHFVEGTWESPDLQTAREELQKRGLSLLHLEEEATPGVQLAEPKGWDLGVSRKALARFTRQFSILLGSGLPLLKTLESVSRRSSGPSLRRAVLEVARQINEGTRLSEALASQPEVFDELYVAMVRVGESNGDLRAATERLALLLEREVAAQRRMGMALAYPLIVLGVSAVLTWGMATFMMPMFEPMFKDGGLNLERDFPVTWFLVQAGHLGSSPAVLIGLLLGVVLAGLALKMLGRTSGGRLLMDQVKLHIPVLSGLQRLILTARLARGLSVLTSGGVPLVQALTQAGQATGNRVYAAAADEMARGVQEGRNLSQQMSGHPLFNSMLIDLVEVGEKSGSLPEMLNWAAEYFDDEADGQRELLTTAMEPLMMLLVGAIVSIFVVALMIPLMSIGQH